MPGGVAFADLAPAPPGGLDASVALGSILELSDPDRPGGEFLWVLMRTPWPADGIRVVFPPGTDGVHAIVLGGAGVPPRYYVAGTRGFRPLESDNSAALGPDDFVDASTARSRLAADPPPTPRWSEIVTRAALATGIVGGIGGANPLVLREGDSPRVLEAALAQFKEALARPPPQPATSVYPGPDHTVAALRKLNRRGKFWRGATPDGRATIKAETLLDACGVGRDLWRSFQPAPEGTLVALYAELAALWWKRQLEALRAEIREFLRPPGEYTHDSRGRVQAVEIKDQHGTPAIRAWDHGKRKLVKLPRGTMCFLRDKDSHPALEDLGGLGAELLKYTARAPKTLTAPSGDWAAVFAQMPCLGDPAVPWSPARPLTYAVRIQLGILAAAVDREAGLGEAMLAAIETVAADHQGPDELADRLAQLKTAAASYASSRHDDKKPIQRCRDPDCVKCCARLVAGPSEAAGDGSSGAAEPAVADLGQRPLLLDVIRRGLEGPPKEERPPPPPPPAVPKPVAFAARRPSSRTKRPIARRSSSTSSLDKRPRLGSDTGGGRSLSASSWSPF
jgi:hypothetical protein